jgi:5'-deoxynucleotidase YfbR-like HD superfamily hydrolase
VDKLTEQMQFTAEAGRLKAVLRQTMLTGPARRENSAEHSWHVALMALTLAEYAPPGTDIARVVAMLLLHDLVEVDAGDLFVYAGPAEQARQRDAELAAADRIFALLPDEQAGDMRALWEEFEERRSAEARFARGIDRLQPMLANVQAGGGTWLEHGITEAAVLEKVQLIEEGSAELGAFATDLIRRAAAAGMLPAGPAG